MTWARPTGTTPRSTGSCVGASGTTWTISATASSACQPGPCPSWTSPRPTPWIMHKLRAITEEIGTCNPTIRHLMRWPRRPSRTTRGVGPGRPGGGVIELALETMSGRGGHHPPPRPRATPGGSFLMHPDEDKYVTDGEIEALGSAESSGTMPPTASQGEPRSPNIQQIAFITGSSTRTTAPTSSSSWHLSSRATGTTSRRRPRGPTASAVTWWVRPAHYSPVPMEPTWFIQTNGVDCARGTPQVHLPVPPQERHRGTSVRRLVTSRCSPGVPPG